MTLSETLDAIRKFGMTYPGAHLHSPWHEGGDLKVKDKTFAFLGEQDGKAYVSCKLPFTGPEALEESYASPTGYGLGRSGWVTFTLPAENLDFDRLKSWIDESYRAVAPKSLVKQLAAG